MKVVGKFGKPIRRASSHKAWATNGLNCLREFCFVPMESLLLQIDEVFAGEDKSEMEALQTNLEIEFSGVKSAHEVSGVRLSESSGNALYMGVALNQLGVVKSGLTLAFDISPRLYQGAMNYSYGANGAGGFTLCIDRMLQCGQMSWVKAVEAQLHALLPVLEARLRMYGIHHAPSAALLVKSEQEVDVAACEAALGLPVKEVDKASLMQPPAEVLALPPGEVEDLRKQRKASSLRL